MTELKLRDVVRYTPASRHCCEGTAIVVAEIVEEVRLHDTYWQSGRDAHILTYDEIASAEVLFNLDDYDELDMYSRGTPREWMTYAVTDRQRITSQHGLQSRYFIRKGAKPDLETQIANAREAVNSAYNEVRLAESQLVYRRQELAELEAKR